MQKNTAQIRVHKRRPICFIFLRESVYFCLQEKHQIFKLGLFSSVDLQRQHQKYFRIFSAAFFVTAKISEYHEIR